MAVDARIIVHLGCLGGCQKPCSPYRGTAMTAQDWTTQSLLARLISFPTISADPNIDLITFCADFLKSTGANVTLIQDETGKKANLYATVGPRDCAGVLLSGHTDVVPVAGQNWATPPFEMTGHNGKLFGRGTADMKGFVACTMMAALKASKMTLKTPLHLALSYDEEVGCIGVRSLIDMLADAPFRPQFCIVGEPTLMQVATGHKGKTAAKVTTTGHAAHSALAPTGLNAIHMACDIIGFLRELQDTIASTGVQDDDYDVPYSTVHVGTMTGGTALNIVPDHAEFMFEIRHLAGDDPKTILAQIEARTEDYLAALRPQFPQANTTISITNSYPSLVTDSSAAVVGFMQELTQTTHTIKVAFGTEGGLFSSVLDVPTVVCGPGSMDQGHKPDEFIEISELEACDSMLDALLARLVEGL
ncbi:acetylornithine deacetylase [Algirhabdus cladophorae]|uniref:acetylornithine deacetylase n=1 Tax=Algirhabdus cladophorae TaxID=3377108 RepID=UPI003B848629